MIAFLAPGQGAERPGMGRELAARWPVAAEILGALEPGLHDTALVQPALVATALATAAVLEELDVRCELAAGHSVGEVAAWALAGGATAGDAVGLARARGRAMSAAARACGGGMWAVTTVPEPLADGLVVAVHNPGQTVLSGVGAPPRGAVVLPTSGPWHSPWMRPAVAPFAAALEALPRRTLRCPLVRGQDGRVTSDDDVARAGLVAQLVSPLGWTGVLGTLGELGVTDVVLLGPGKLLATHLATAIPQVRVHRTDRARDLDATATALAGPRPSRAR
ncbi:MAG: ACP S-malonyltransferase [Alphaproteobacteria bacterium]|nr:ACP S-malonyltransferase [Alphaproteobacteria bacterium]